MAVVTIKIRKVPTDSNVPLWVWMMWLVRPTSCCCVTDNDSDQEGGWTAVKELHRATISNGRFVWHVTNSAFDPASWELL